MPEKLSESDHITVRDRMGEILDEYDVSIEEAREILEELIEDYEETEDSE